MSSFNIRNRYFFLADLILNAGLPFVAFALRTESFNWQPYGPVLLGALIVTLAIKIPVFWWFGLYQHYWRYASIDELLSIAKAVLATTGILAALHIILGLTGWPPLAGFPRSYVAFDGLLTLVLVGGTRFSIRLLAHRSRRHAGPGIERTVLIVGAGDAGSMLARELHTNPRNGLRAIGFCDDDPVKHGMRIQGVPVLGSLANLPNIVQQYSVQEVLIAMPAAPGKVIREVIKACERAGVAARILPGISELLSGQVSVSRLRHIEIEDLLRREPAQIDPASLTAMIEGKTVMVTGAGGSIGSELCRQVLRYRPSRLLLLGHGENSLFNLSNELNRFAASLHLAQPIPMPVLVADVRDRQRMADLFERYQPQLVFHAAAHKHVPLMEANLEDAVTNNIMGTQVVVELCDMFNVERFVLISSDKAVNPVSVMGVTKRVAERVVGEVARFSGRPYVAVRFGNVLGSRGSVVPIFREQIANGGPVTVTHPDMQRYFMTIPEAVQLVMQAAALSAQGNVFILDMAQPVKIVDLARDLITLSGLQEGRDIDIEYTGLRPGEKLVEELFLRDEQYQRTNHQHIFVVKNGFATDDEQLRTQVNALLAAAQNGQPAEVRALLKLIVPEFGDSLVEAQTSSPVDSASLAPPLPDNVLSSTR
jgi:FlaA1/EpsC-like NDP-sugar epimerase